MPGSQQIVIDASFALHLVFPTPTRPQARAVFENWISQGLTLAAPDLWVYEVVSAVCKAVHFGAISTEMGDQVLEQLTTLPIEFFSPAGNIARLAYAWTLRLKRAAAYDSFYLALAQTLGCELWTADRRLFNAAGQEWVHCVQ